MKNKVKPISKNEFNKWVEISNIFANSLIQPQKALEQFNRLSSKQRHNIKQSLDKYDKIRNQKIPIEDRNDDSYLLDVLVDIHIIATENNIDPLTTAMCIDPQCKANERVAVLE